MDIPEDFLQAPPPPNATIKKLDFTKTTPPIPAYKNHFAAIIDNALTPVECNRLLLLAEQSIAPKNTNDPDPGNTPWDRALLNTVTILRECDIVQISGQPLVTGAGPATRGETFKLTRLNEKLRFLKYTGGEYFRAHTDGCYVTPDERERSLFTVHLYLNGEGEQDEGELQRAIARRDRVDARVSDDNSDWGVVFGDGDGDADEDIESEEEKENIEGARKQTLLGGATSFRLESFAGERVVRVFPKTGSVLVFQQRGLCHAGDDVFRGVKYTMRSDVMYEKVEN
ncbi:hypothetical protein AARAC_004728 [Aspergillus arachidicola]|uniref:Prolyl 4-hydroxylase alpha subunit domain-containing protein n=1 Tax=Aspergillus arachidicola TaxID=656916 RepID=A0A2G7G303_9EURO|nr:hypothetical protein AARAC_004728 [Aspergillus arachidicola]